MNLSALRRQGGPLVATLAVVSLVIAVADECSLGDLPLRLVGGLTSGSIYALIALGYTLVYGVLRLINFAHSEVFTGGMFGALVLLNAVVGQGNDGNVFHLVLAAIPAMAVGAGIALTLERTAYRPLRRRGASRLSFLISAIGMSLFLQSVFLIWRGRGFENFPETIGRTSVLEIGRVEISNFDVIIFLAMIVMVVGLDFLVRKTKVGKGIRAVAQDAETASLMGVNIDRVISSTFLIGGALAGVAAVLWGLRFPMRFDVGFLPGIKAFTAAVLGGIGNIRGALLGGLFLGIIENIGAGCFGDAWKDVVAFTVLVIVLMFRPTGLLGEAASEGKA